METSSISALGESLRQAQETPAREVWEMLGACGAGLHGSPNAEAELVSASGLLRPQRLSHTRSGGSR